LLQRSTVPVLRQYLCTAADAIHGDLGMVQQDDIIIVISKSGDSPEIKVLVPLIKNFGNILIGMVGNMDSFLARQSEIVLKHYSRTGGLSK
jgi:arabinose-5-phosphate isomerase